MSKDYHKDDNKPIKFHACGNLPVVCISEGSESSEQFEDNNTDMKEVVTLDEQNCAAIKIQASWRNYLVQRNLRRAPSPEEEGFTDEQYLSALIIQNFYRDYITEKRLKVKQEKAAQVIQHHYRQYLRKSEEEFEADLERAAQIAQQSYNQLQSENESNTALIGDPKSKDSPVIPSSHEEKNSNEDVRQNEAAVTIQRKYKKRLRIQKKKLSLEKTNKAAISIKKQFRKYYTEKNNAAIKIQTQYRYHLENKKAIAAGLEIDNNAAIKIQTQYRSHLKNKKAVVADLENKKAIAACLEIKNNAATKIQSKYRSHLENKKAISADLDTKKNNMEYSFDPISFDDITKSSDDEYYMPEIAAITIQKHYKSHYAKRVSAATLIQNEFRSYKKFKTRNEAQDLSEVNEKCLSSQDTEEQKAVTLIQRQYRAHLIHVHLSEKRSRDNLHDSQESYSLANNIEKDDEHIDTASSLEQSISLVLGDEDIKSVTRRPGEEEDEIVVDDRTTVYGDSTIQFETTTGMNNRGSIYKKMVDDIPSTGDADGASIDDDIINWHKSLSTKVPSHGIRPSPKAPGPEPAPSREPEFNIEPRRNFDKKWPESKKNQQQKVKDSPRKKQVQASLEMKRVQRKNEKNKRKDIYHLSNLRKQAPNPKFTEAIDKKQENGPKKVKKSDTPQIKQNHQSNDITSESEILDPRETTEEDSSPINILSVETREETPPSALEEEDTALKAVTSALITDNQGAVLKPSNNINLQYSKSTHPNENKTHHRAEQVQDALGGRVARRLSDQVQDALGGRVARRLSDQSSLGSGTQQITSNNTSSNKVALGSLDSYAVQNMLKRNHLLTRQFVFQKNDNQSYLQTYLKQMNVIKRPSREMISINQETTTNKQRQLFKQGYFGGSVVIGGDL
ncbi:abnormal spindle-like microcephaly-associated protein homolog [Bolinopsis microptera]|uniref:abnormal spindle-like microcephaly-associated protein homolog n=1 Tax=Bolinopsis microptera TaxID=2820187 RepID=UPI003079EBD7